MFCRPRVAASIGNPDPAMTPPLPPRPRPRRRPPQPAPPAGRCCGSASGRSTWVPPLFGMLAVPLWIALLLGQVSLHLTVSPLLWHAHEMLFGFAVAVIVGFLLTAGKAWTGLATPRGALAGRAGRAVAGSAAGGRAGALCGLRGAGPAAAAAGGRHPDRACCCAPRNRRNLPLGAILVLLALANLAFHAGRAGRRSTSPPCARCTPGWRWS